MAISLYHNNTSCHHLFSFVILIYHVIFLSSACSARFSFRHSFSATEHTSRSDQSFSKPPSLFCYLSFLFYFFRLVLFSYSHSFVCIYICHISLIQFSISSYHLFFISHFCSYSIFILYTKIYSQISAKQ